MMRVAQSNENKMHSSSRTQQHSSDRKSRYEQKMNEFNAMKDQGLKDMAHFNLEQSKLAGYISVTLLALLIINIFVSHLSGVGVVVSLVIWIIASLCIWDGLTSVSQHNYYTFTGSKNKYGEHQCLHCGNKGIYTHGQYKSNTKYSDCSKCKTLLWKS